MYLDIEDLKKGIRAEVLNTLTRGDGNVCTQAIEEASSEVESYLSARYDIASELSKTIEDERLPMVVKLVRDIAIFNIYNFTAPVNIPDNRIKCYDNAVKLLKDAQAEKANIVGLNRLVTLPDGTVASSYVAFGSNKKRQNHF